MTRSVIERLNGLSIAEGEKCSTLHIENTYQRALEGCEKALGPDHNRTRQVIERLNRIQVCIAVGNSAQPSPQNIIHLFQYILSNRFRMFILSLLSRHKKYQKLRSLSFSTVMSIESDDLGQVGRDLELPDHSRSYGTTTVKRVHTVEAEEGDWYHEADLPKTTHRWWLLPSQICRNPRGFHGILPNFRTYQVILHCTVP